MKNRIWLAALVGCMILAGCAKDESIAIIGGADGPTQIYVSSGNKEPYLQISVEDAKAIMDMEENEIILDVREQEEFDEGHIAGSILIPHEQIKEQAEALLPDKDQFIFVYSRNGQDSKIASEALAQMGYTNVLEFGGITDWPYELEQ